MTNSTKRMIAAFVAFLAVIGLVACDNDSDVVSENISTEADNYKVFRQIVVVNTITDKYLLEVEGFCSLGNDDPKGTVSYTCKVDSDGKQGSKGYIKDIVKVSDNVTVYAHQLQPIDVSSDYYKVTLKPTTIVPDFEYNG